MSYFWQQLRPVTLDLSGGLSSYRQMMLAGRLSFATVSLPVFSISGIPWLGASFIAVEFPVDLGVNVNLQYPVNPPAGVNFCLAVRWGNVTRRKLWQGVGEILDFPMYAGETLTPPFTFEIWTVQGKTAVSLAMAFAIQTSKVAVREVCIADCSELAENTNTEVRDVLFSGYIDYYDNIALPIVFIETLIEVIARQ